MPTTPFDLLDRERFDMETWDAYCEDGLPLLEGLLLLRSSLIGQDKHQRIPHEFI